MTKGLRDDDHILLDEGTWIEVKGFAVRINTTDEGIVVDVYKSGAETEPPVASTYAFDSDLLEEEEL